MSRNRKKRKPLRQMLISQEIKSTLGTTVVNASVTPPFLAVIKGRVVEFFLFPNDKGRKVLNQIIDSGKIGKSHELGSTLVEHPMYTVWTTVCDAPEWEHALLMGTGFHAKYSSVDWYAQGEVTVVVGGKDAKR